MAEEVTPQAANQSVTVSYGPYKAVINGAGKTVKEIRESLQEKWSIDAGAKGFIGKQQLQDDAVVSAGSTLTLFRVQGEKGI